MIVQYVCTIWCQLENISKMNFYNRVIVIRFADHEYRVDARLFDDGSWLNIAKELFDEIVYQNPLFVNYGLWHEVSPFRPNEATGVNGDLKMIEYGLQF